MKGFGEQTRRYRSTEGERRGRGRHLYEAVISNSRMWLKVQGSCLSPEQSAGFFGFRFTGTNYLVDGRPVVTPFRLSDRSHEIANWESIVNRLPPGWNDDEFQMVESPYPWCETLTDGCDCHGMKGRRDQAVCSGFGLHDETDKLTGKSANVRHQHYISTMEERIASRDEAWRQHRLQREQPSPPVDAAPVAVEAGGPGSRPGGVQDLLGAGMNRVSQLASQGFYCSIHDRHHAYDKQAIEKTVTDVSAASLQMAGERNWRVSLMSQIAAHWLGFHQAKQCAQQAVRGNAEIPDTLYKYIPKTLIGQGAPNSLRATQLLALNDDMECNVTTRKGSEEEDTLTFLRVVQSKMEEHLGITVPWAEMLERSVHYIDVRLSTIIQEYLNPRVGVVSLSTDILVPTMWAHYARNTGIVVGYDTEALNALGFELRPVVYSELAPSYRPSEGETIWLNFVNREYMLRELRSGRSSKGLQILTRTELAQFGAGWKSLSRLLLVKGMSWAYEKEVRLLVDLEQTRDTGKKDCDGWPVKVIDPPPEAIREIYRGVNTREEDVERAVQVARGENPSGLFVGRVSSHAFRIQKTGGMRH